MDAKSPFSKGTSLRFPAVLAAALLAWAAWYLGIVWFNGSEGLAWLRGFQWGALPACFFIAVACAAAAVHDFRPWRMLLFLAAATGLCFAAFAGARDELYLLHLRWLAPAAGPAPIVRLALYLAAVSASLAWLAGRLLGPMRPVTALYVADALALAPLCGYATVAVFPGDRHSDIYNAIRLGYPVFWAAILAPAALRLGRKPPGNPAV